MQLRKIINDDNAVSPVIGVILMVAITVILAAVIATFVLGLGDNLSNTAPQASFGTDYDANPSFGSADGNLTVTHDGGDTIKAAELFLRGSSVNSFNTTGNWSALGYSPGGIAPTDDISAGTSVTIAVNSGDTVRVTYEGEDGGQSATLSKWTGPDA